MTSKQKEFKLKLSSPVPGAEPVVYSWPLKKSKEYDGALEIIETIRFVCQEQQELRVVIEKLVLNQVDTKNYESMKKLCDKYNRAVDTIKRLWEGATRPTKCSDRAHGSLLRHIVQQCYNRSVTDPDRLNQYEPFSPEVYGETSYDLVNKMIEEICPTEKDTFIDLGSGVGQVIMQMAGGSECKMCYGIEKQDWPCRFAESMEKEFRRWTKWYGKKHQPFQLIKGDFLSPQYRDHILGSSIIFVNNFAFGPDLDHKLKLIFEQLPHGTKIVSSKPFCPISFRITDRNLSDIGCILDVSVLSPLRNAVSWTGTAVAYYMHVIDRTKLENYFQTLKYPVAKSDEPRRSRGGSSSNTHSKSSSSRESSITSCRSAKPFNEDEGSFDRPPYGPTTRRQWNDWVEQQERMKKELDRQRKNASSSSKSDGSRPSLQSRRSKRSSGAELRARQTKKKYRHHARRASGRMQMISSSLDLLHQQSLSAAATSHRGPPSAGCSSISLASLQSPSRDEAINTALDAYLAQLRQQFLGFFDQMKAPDFRQTIISEIEKEKERRRELQCRIGQVELHVSELQAEGVQLLKRRIQELGIEADYPAELLNKAKEIVLHHKELQSQVSNMECEVRMLEQQQEQLGVPDYGSVQDAKDVVIKSIIQEHNRRLMLMEEIARAKEDVDQLTSAFAVASSLSQGMPQGGMSGGVSGVSMPVMASRGPSGVLRGRSSGRGRSRRSGSSSGLAGQSAIPVSSVPPTNRPLPQEEAESSEDIERKIQDIVRKALSVDSAAKSARGIPLATPTESPKYTRGVGERRRGSRGRSSRSAGGSRRELSIAAQGPITETVHSVATAMSTPDVPYSKEMSGLSQMISFSSPGLVPVTPRSSASSVDPLPSSQSQFEKPASAGPIIGASLSTSVEDASLDGFPGRSTQSEVGDASNHSDTYKDITKRPNSVPILVSVATSQAQFSIQALIGAAEHSKPAHPSESGGEGLKSDDVKVELGGTVAEMVKTPVQGQLKETDAASITDSGIDTASCVTDDVTSVISTSTTVQQPTETSSSTILGERKEEPGADDANESPMTTSAVDSPATESGVSEDECRGTSNAGFAGSPHEHSNPGNPEKSRSTEVRGQPFPSSFVTQSGVSSPAHTHASNTGYPGNPHEHTNPGNPKPSAVGSSSKETPGSSRGKQSASFSSLNTHKILLSQSLADLFPQDMQARKSEKLEGFRIPRSKKMEPATDVTIKEGGTSASAAVPSPLGAVSSRSAKQHDKHTNWSGQKMEPLPKRAGTLPNRQQRDPVRMTFSKSLTQESLAQHTARMRTTPQKQPPETKTSLAKDPGEVPGLMESILEEKIRTGGRVGEGQPVVSHPSLPVDLGGPRTPTGTPPSSSAPSPKNAHASDSSSPLIISPLEMVDKKGTIRKAGSSQKQARSSIVSDSKVQSLVDRARLDGFPISPSLSASQSNSAQSEKNVATSIVTPKLPVEAMKRPREQSGTKSVVTSAPPATISSVNEALKALSSGNLADPNQLSALIKPEILQNLHNVDPSVLMVSLTALLGGLAQALSSTSKAPKSAGAPGKSASAAPSLARPSVAVFPKSESSALQLKGPTTPKEAPPSDVDNLRNDMETSSSTSSFGQSRSRSRRGSQSPSGSSSYSSKSSSSGSPSPAAKRLKVDPPSAVALQVKSSESSACAEPFGMAKVVTSSTALTTTATTTAEATIAAASGLKPNDILSALTAPPPAPPRVPSASVAPPLPPERSTPQPPPPQAYPNYPLPMRTLEGAPIRPQNHPISSLQSIPAVPLPLSSQPDAGSGGLQGVLSTMVVGSGGVPNPGAMFAMGSPFAVSAANMANIPVMSSLSSHVPPHPAHMGSQPLPGNLPLPPPTSLAPAISLGMPIPTVPSLAMFGGRSELPRTPPPSSLARPMLMQPHGPLFQAPGVRTSLLGSADQRPQLRFPPNAPPGAFPHGEIPGMGAPPPSPQPGSNLSIVGATNILPVPGVTPAGWPQNPNLQNPNLQPLPQTASSAAPAGSAPFSSSNQMAPFSSSNQISSVVDCLATKASVAPPGLLSSLVCSDQVVSSFGANGITFNPAVSTLADGPRPGVQLQTTPRSIPAVCSSQSNLAHPNAVAPSSTAEASSDVGYISRAEMDRLAKSSGDWQRWNDSPTTKTVDSGESRSTQPPPAFQGPFDGARSSPSLPMGPRPGAIPSTSVAPDFSMPPPGMRFPPPVGANLRPPIPSSADGTMAPNPIVEMCAKMMNQLQSLVSAKQGPGEGPSGPPPIRAASPWDQSAPVAPAGVGPDKSRLPLFPSIAPPKYEDFPDTRFGNVDSCAWQAGSSKANTRGHLGDRGHPRGHHLDLGRPRHGHWNKQLIPDNLASMPRNPELSADLRNDGFKPQQFAGKSDPNPLLGPLISVARPPDRPPLMDGFRGGRGGMRGHEWRGGGRNIQSSGPRRSQPRFPMNQRGGHRHFPPPRNPW